MLVSSPVMIRSSNWMPQTPGSGKSWALKPVVDAGPWFPFGLDGCGAVLFGPYSFEAASVGAVSVGQHT